jgi:predicted permease
VKLLRCWNIAAMRFRSLLRRDQVESELDRELRFHLQRLMEEHLAAGMPPAEAKQAALRALGGVAQIQEECRDMRRTQYIDQLWQDLQYAVRVLRKSPTFTFILVLTLALSIGANSAIFSVIDAVLLRPLPYPEPSRLTRVFYSSAEYPTFPLNPFDFLDFRSRNHSFEGLAAYSRGDMQLSGAGRPVRLHGFRVTAAYFRVLGIQPAHGREFDFGDERPGNFRIAILSDRLWRSQFAADPGIVGRKIMLDSQPFTVVGVMPPGIDHPGNRYNAVAYGDTVDFWWPFTFEGNPNNRGSHYIEGIGRLRRGMGPEAAQSDLDAIRTQIAREHPGQNNWHPLVNPLYQEIVRPVHQMLLLLLGAVGLVLLIACANAANLLLARAATRQREMAVRTALGAGRSRLIRQMFAESLVIALLGGGLGAALAAGGVSALVSRLPSGFPRAAAIHVNGSVLGFTLIIALATGFLFGLAPALQAARSDPQSGLKEGGRGGTGGRRYGRVRNILVIAEIGLACVLLIGAGLLLRSFVNMLNTQPGFRAERLLTASISLPQAQYKGIKTPLFYARLAQDLASLPGVEAAGMASDLPWTGYDDNIGGFTVEGKPKEVAESSHARYHLASPDYFKALGVPLLRGRFFDDRDKPEPPAVPVMLINQAMAREYWAGEDAVGKRIAFSDNPKPDDWMTVVGVVGDVKDKPEDAAAQPALWWPLSQAPVLVPSMAVALRSNGDPASLANQVRRTVEHLDPNLAVSDIRMMDQIAHESFSTARFSLLLVTLFAGLALALAAIGIYGVIAYSVSQRTQEFGMRMALGAPPIRVMRMVMAQGIRLAVIGTTFGLSGALVLTRLMGTFLYGVRGSDPLTFGAVSVVAILTAVSACYPSARRATSADPMTALRAE